MRTGRPLITPLAWTAAIALTALGITAVLAPDAAATPVLGSFSQVVADLVGLVMCARAALHTRGRARQTWAVFAAALGCWLIADLAATIALLIGLEVPEVSVLDIGWLGFNVLSLTGVAMLYARLRPEKGWQGALDGVALALALGIFSWVLILGPVAARGSGGGIGTAVNLLYPATALAGFVAIGWIVLRIGRQTPGWLVWILAAFGVQTVAESVYLVAALNGAQLSEWTSWVAYAATGWLWALAGAARCQAGPRLWAAGRHTHPPAWSQAIPAVVGLSAIALLAPSHGVVGTLTVVTVVLVAVRLSITLRLNNRLIAERDRLAMTDPLTGAYNRRRLDQEVVQLDARARRNDSAVAAIALDIDCFKNVNDSLGHAAGDAMLVLVAVAAAEEIRQGDMVFRVGGDEFVILMPDTTMPEAAAVADRIRANVADATRLVYPQSPTTVSLGVAQGPRPGKPPSALLLAADTALYRAKRAGRDRVMLHGTGVAAPPRWAGELARG
jgi:diguanylate cyclase (GGDEF)-like protein